MERRGDMKNRFFIIILIAALIGAFVSIGHPVFASSSDSEETDYSSSEELTEFC